MVDLVSGGTGRGKNSKHSCRHYQRHGKVKL